MCLLLIFIRVEILPIGGREPVSAHHCRIAHFAEPVMVASKRFHEFHALIAFAGLEAFFADHKNNQEGQPTTLKTCTKNQHIAMKPIAQRIIYFIRLF